MEQGVSPESCRSSRSPSGRLATAIWIISCPLERRVDSVSRHSKPRAYSAVNGS